MLSSIQVYSALSPTYAVCVRGNANYFIQWGHNYYKLGVHTIDGESYTFLTNTTIPHYCYVVKVTLKN